MSAIVTTVLKGTLGFLIKKGRKVAVERLKDSDVTNEKLKNWIVDEIDSINSKLDAMAKKDLGASISFFKEGLVFLNNAMETITCGLGSLNASPVQVGKVKNVKEEDFEESNEKANPEASKQEANLNLNSLDEIKVAILDAKKRFDDARRKATEAFNNEVLTPMDRILAMGVRLMATILEKVDNPVSALDACISGLNELHSMPFVTENFSVELEKGIKSRFSKDERRQIVSFACQVNRTIYDFALLVSAKEVLSFWPCVEIANERVDPLRDSRIANMLRKLEMGDFCLPWSFGQKDELEHQRLASATSIATNTLGQFLVVDLSENCAKMFDASGKFLKTFCPFTHTESTFSTIQAVATDQDDNIYVLEGKISDGKAKVCLHVLNNLAQFLNDLKVGIDLEARTVKVTASRLVLVLVRTFRLSREVDGSSTIENDYVVLKDTKGKRIGYLSSRMFRPLKDITAADDLIMILDDSSYVTVFREANVSEEDCPVSPFLKAFPVRGDACAITFHPRSKHVIIVSQIEEQRWQLLFYSKEGKFERSIDLDVEQDYEITGAAVTTDGRICIAASNFRENRGKVLVV
ncbi:unnamed protein product [Porites lobata]|uniref:Uncharacterized protein n=1 Tax=Porites lobata TaxID=104759 RepID=A0ABN8P5G9_9CNID|nr:unnamed protein product [Porites lobata]